GRRGRVHAAGRFGRPLSVWSRAVVTRRPLTRAVLAFVGAVIVAAMLTPAASASTYSVTSTADAGPGTLRQAILDATPHPGAHTARLNLPGPGLHTIAITSKQLPAIIDPLLINGKLQPGF